MATYNNTVFVLNQAAPYQAITLTSTDNLTLNLATITLQTSAALDLGTSGVTTTVKGLFNVDEAATFDGDVTIAGNLVLSGSTKVVELNSTQVLIGDNHLYLNNAYTTGVARTGGLVVNFLPLATTDTVDTGGFTAGVVGVSNPTVATVGAATFATGDFIQISGAHNPANNGLFEVLSQAANVLEIRGVGTTATVEDFTQNQFVTDSTVAGDIYNVTVSVMRAGTTGAWETGYGSASGISFSPVGGGGGSGTDSLTYTINQDNVGADEDAALYLDSGDGTNVRQGRVTMNYSNSSQNGLVFSFDSAPAATDYGFGFYLTPTSGGAASGGSAAGSGGQFYLVGGSGGAAGAGAGAPGVGGAITLRGGSGGMGGAGSTDGAAGGPVTLSGGGGGMAAGGTAGSGGDLTLSGGLGASGSGTGASLVLAGGGGGNLGAATLTAKNIDIGASAAARTVNVGTGAAAQTVTIGSTNTTSSLTLDSGTGALNIGTGAQARTISIGNAAATAVNVDATAITLTSVDALTLTDGIATFALGGTGAATLSGATTVDLDATGAFSINSTGGAINIGNDANAQAVNIGTGAAARNVTVGTTNSTATTTINAGSGGINFGGAIVGLTANAAENVTVGDTLYRLAAGTVGLADANSAGKKTVFGIALNTATTGNPVKVATMPGQFLVVNTDLSAAAIGDVVFADITTPGGLVVTAPGGSGTDIYKVGEIHVAGVAGTAQICFLPQFIVSIA